MRRRRASEVAPGASPGPGDYECEGSRGGARAAVLLTSRTGIAPRYGRSTRAAHIHQGPDQPANATTTYVERRKRTTLSKSSSSQYPPSHVGSGGSANATGVSPRMRHATSSRSTRVAKCTTHDDPSAPWTSSKVGAVSQPQARRAAEALGQAQAQPIVRSQWRHEGARRTK